ncbi:MAG: [Fe-Fe] hydrogenase large subunit C-terminal domain-containing protein, partial [Acutalibacteraceae bacterium]
LAKMIKAQQIQFTKLPDSDFDPALGITTGAGAIFGATGGVMEAALRTAADTLTGQSLEEIDYKEVRGTEGIKEATYNVAGIDVKVAVASGLKNAAKVLDKVKSGEADYQFIEIMCCPGGCVNGGGQPIQPASVRNFTDLKADRAKALYEEDLNLPLRKSHDSPIIKQVYEEFLEKPGSHKAHEILHTTYVARKKY